MVEVYTKIMPTLTERAQATLDRLQAKGLLPRLNRQPSLPEVLGGEVAPPPPRWTPTEFPGKGDGSTLFSLYQSEDHSLRLYVTYDKEGVPTYSFTTYFMDAPWPMVDPDEASLDRDWARLVHQYRLGYDVHYLKEKLKEAGMVGALRVADGFHDGRVMNEQKREAARAFHEKHQGKDKEAVVAILERTIGKVKAHRGGFLIHEVSEVEDDKGFAVGCSVYITGYMGG